MVSTLTTHYCYFHLETYLDYSLFSQSPLMQVGMEYLLFLLAHLFSN